MASVFDVPVKDSWFKIEVEGNKRIVVDGIVVVEEDLKRHSLTPIPLKRMELVEGGNGKLRETYVKVSEALIGINGSDEVFLRVGEHPLNEVQMGHLFDFLTWEVKLSGSPVKVLFDLREKRAMVKGKIVGEQLRGALFKRGKSTAFYPKERVILLR
uniref:Retroviral aspartyl protease n=1 Tax=Caenorhabditis tropicalis TaxID=1561998 RepID=A0A1I7USL3_9PELO